MMVPGERMQVRLRSKTSGCLVQPSVETKPTPHPMGLLLWKAAPESQAASSFELTPGYSIPTAEVGVELGAGGEELVVQSLAVSTATISITHIRPATEESTGHIQDESRKTTGNRHCRHPASRSPARRRCLHQP